MTKSPRAVAQTALQLAREALPAYSCRTSRKDYTRHQLSAILALETFLKTDYRGVVAFLADFARSASTSGSRGCPTTRPCATPNGGS